MIISTHEIDEIENLVEHVVFIDSGRAPLYSVDADELRCQEGKSIVTIMKEAFRHGSEQVEHVLKQTLPERNGTQVKTETYFVLALGP